MERSKVWEAAQRHKDGYNCCQAVVCTYCDRLGMDEQTAFRASEAYGLGIAGMFQTCGSVCAMMMLAGLKNSDGNMESPASKFATFELGQEMAKRFEQKNTSMICSVLRGTDGKTDRLRSCRGCVMDCAQIVEASLSRTTDRASCSRLSLHANHVSVEWVAQLFTSRDRVSIK